MPSFDFNTLFYDDYNGIKWTTQGVHRTVTWSTVDDTLELSWPPGSTAAVVEASAPYLSLYQTAFDLWDNALDHVSFLYTDEGNEAEVTLGVVEIDGSGGMDGRWGARWVNDIFSEATIEFDTVGIQQGDLLTTALHEIGNILGLGDILPTTQLQSVQEDPFPMNFSGAQLWADDVDIIRSYYGEGMGPTDLLYQGTLDADTIRAEAGNDTIKGEAGNDTIMGHGGYDWIVPGRGNDTVDGGADRDMVTYSDVAEVAGRGAAFMLDLDLGAGTAKIFGGEVDQLTSVERVTGSIFADVMRGSDGNDELRGIGDYDWFIATAGNDTLNGGNGYDMVTFLEAESSGAAVVQDVFSIDGAPPVGGAVGGVSLNLADGSQNTGLATGLTLISVERVTGSSHQDVFYGDGENNDFRGLGGYDWFVSSGGGRERYNGGDGLDTVTYYNAAAGVGASLRNGNGLSGGQETGYGTAGDAMRDLYFEIENLVGSNFDDDLEGNNERNQLSGLDGDDMIFGYGNTDYIKGGAGSDYINGGAGSDYALYDGDVADYTLTRTGSWDVTISHADGTDTLEHVEYFVFDDTTVNVWELAIV